MSERFGWLKRHKIWTGVIVAVLLLGIIGSLAGDKNQNNKSDSSAKSGSSVPVTTTQEQKSATMPGPAAAAESKQPDVPTEYKSALSKATAYASTQHMSKQGVYDQLTSEYGEKFSAEAAKYAIDNIKSDWNANALAKAKSYQEMQSMSPAAIHDQLTSDYGEKFTQAEADYAVQHLND